MYDKTLLRERLEQLSEKWSGMGKTHKKISVCLMLRANLYFSYEGN